MDKKNIIESEIKNNIYKQLIDPKFPIIQEFREIAPGTMEHSENVASLCKELALEMDLDIDLLVCAAIYHDIGKMYNPKYFAENITGENPHDKLEPFVSYNIITRHVGDSVLKLLEIEDLPIKVIELVSQHHGNTILRSIFSKTTKESEDNYRYKCHPPKSLEAIILMICDSVEAMARTLNNVNKLNTDEDKINVVESTIKRLTDEGQLNELKIGELKRIKACLIKKLEKMYHKRVIYEEMDGKGEENAIR